MPTFAQGSRSSLSYIEEVTFNTTPAGNFQSIPFTTHSLNLTKERVQGNDIFQDRMPRVDRHGNKQAGGDIVVDLRSGAYDALLESVMLGAWDASPISLPDELKVGITPKYFTFEDYAADIDQARLFTGQTMSSMAVSIANNQMITATFTVVGADSSISTTEATLTAASTAAPFDSHSGDLLIGDQGDAGSTACVTSLDFTIDNAFQTAHCMFSDVTPTLNYGRAIVEGTFSAYFEDETLLNRFINEANSKLEVSVNDPTGSNEYTFLFPYIKINSADVSVTGPESRMVECSFVALYDATEESNLVIKRPDSS